MADTKRTMADVERELSEMRALVARLLPQEPQAPATPEVKPVAELKLPWDKLAEDGTVARYVQNVLIHQARWDLAHPTRTYTDKESGKEVTKSILMPSGEPWWSVLQGRTIPEKAFTLKGGLTDRFGSDVVPNEPSAYEAWLIQECSPWLVCDWSGIKGVRQIRLVRTKNEAITKTSGNDF